jgi:SAM-dependent methyltransferase
MDEQRRTVREGYDAIAGVYDEERASDTDHAALERLEAALPDEPRLLDLGCGAGRGPLSHLPSEHAVGLDFSTAQLELARERTDAGLVAGDMTALPFEADRFEAVTAFYSVIHLPLADHATCYEEVARVLEPGGQFLFSIGDDWAGENPDWLDSGEAMAWSFPPLSETEALLEAAGLEVEERLGVRSEMDDADWPFLSCRRR